MPPRKPPGLTLIEILVACSMLAMLLLAVLVVYVNGSRAWSKGDAQAELLGALQTGLRRIELDLSQTVYDSVTIHPSGSAVAVLSAADAADGYRLTEAGSPRWRRYVILYCQENELRRLEVPLVAGAPQEATPTPIEAYDPGSGKRPLEGYLAGGRVLSRGVSRFQAVLEPNTRLLRFSLTAEKKRYGRSDPEKLTLDSAVHLWK